MNDQPYDLTGWTLPLQMGVAAVRVDDAFSAPLSAVSSVRPPGGTFIRTENAAGYLIRPEPNHKATLTNRLLKVGADVSWLSKEVSRGDVDFAPGTLWVENVEPDELSSIVAELGLFARGLKSAPKSDRLRLRRPRVALYRPHTASMDEGWTRWLLERYDFDFQNLRNSDVHAGDLRDRYDVIVLPAERPGALKDGHAEGAVPARYAGGLGDVGIRALDAFVRAGGTLVAMNQASDLVIDELHLPVRNVVSELGREEFFSSGSIMEVESDVAHPVMAGMPELAKVFFDRSPVFTVEEGFAGSALLKYQRAGSPLLSGYLLGEEHVQGYAAALDVRYGEGHVVLLGFRPQWRGQPFGTFRALFNSVLFSEDVAEEASGSDGFWAPPVEPEDGAESPDPSPGIGGI